jgi:hypothetical protein
MHLLTKILSHRLYNVNLDTEFATTNKHNMSDYFTGNRHSTQLNNTGSKSRPHKTRSRHQSIHGDPKAILSRSGRPISSGSSGQLMDLNQSERSLQSSSTFNGYNSPSAMPSSNDSADAEPKNGSTSSLLGGSNLISRSFKAGDRRSTPFASTSTAVGEGRTKDSAAASEDATDLPIAPRPISGAVRFGLKSIIPNTGMSGKLIRRRFSLPFVLMLEIITLDKGHSASGGISTSIEASSDFDKVVSKKEHGSLTFSSKFADSHSDNKSDKGQEGDRKSINSLGERQLTDENLGIPNKVS